MLENRVLARGSMEEVFYRKFGAFSPVRVHLIKKARPKIARLFFSS